MRAFDKVRVKTAQAIHARLGDKDAAAMPPMGFASILRGHQEVLCKFMAHTSICSNKVIGLQRP